MGSCASKPKTSSGDGRNADVPHSADDTKAAPAVKSFVGEIPAEAKAEAAAATENGGSKDKEAEAALEAKPAAEEKAAEKKDDAVDQKVVAASA